MIAGIDISTRKVAIVGFDGESYVDPYEVESRGRVAADRFPDLVDGVNGWLCGHQPAAVYVEGLPFVKSRNGIVSIASVLGAVRAVVHLHGRRCVVVPGYEWKRGLGVGPRKDDVTRWALTRNVDLWSQDLTDAFAIAVYGWGREHGDEEAAAVRPSLGDRCVHG